MLRHTFQHIPGLGERRERALWRRGIQTWEDLLAAPQRSGLPERLVNEAEAILHLSEEALRRGNIYFFAQLLPAREHWRLYGDFQAATAYLDIETGPLGNGRQGITVIGLFDGQEFRSFVRGDNLHTFESYVRRYDLLVTFNGKSFDLPVIERELGIPIYQAQIDLRLLLQRLGYRGGLKRIERQWGIIRDDDIAGLTGFDAVLLWARYQRGEAAALERLIAYNRADVVNLEVLLKGGYELARAQLDAALSLDTSSSERWSTAGSGGEPSLREPRQENSNMVVTQAYAPHTTPELDAIAQWLRRPENDHFLVASHVNPDGDGLASMLACAHLLRRLGKQVWLVADGQLSSRYRYLPQIDTVTLYRDGLEHEIPVANVITVDVPVLSRLERVACLIPPTASIVKVDHHPSDESFGLFNYVDASASSTAELVYHLCVALDVPFDAALGTWLYTGIAFDTGRFRFSSTTPTALGIAGEMVAAGANPQLIAEQLFYEYRPTTLSLLASTLQSLQRPLNGRVAVLALDHAVLGQACYQDEDADGFVDYAVSLQGIEVALFLREHEPGQIRVSLRAKHDFDVRAVAEVFGGGGHRKAAGARLSGSIEAATARLLAEIEPRLG